MQNTPRQTSKLLPALFESVGENQRVSVLHIGPALSETINFFSGFRCKLQFVDLFSELPFIANEQEDIDLQIHRLLGLPTDTRFDVCLFWDFFNFLNAETIEAFQTVLKPHLKDTTRAHAFSMHNPRTDPYKSHLYSIQDLHSLTLRERSPKPPGYAPHSQRRLKEMLTCFSFERSVLLSDKRLELLLQAKP